MVRAVIDIEGIVAAAEPVQALPTTVARLAALVAEGDAPVKEVVDVVSFDQALTADLLRQANSVAGGGTVQVRTVRDATVRLGPSAVTSMARAAGVSHWMRGSLPAYGPTEGQLWRHSVAASLAAEVIRSKAQVDVPSEAATAALLHDFGKVVLSRHFGPHVLEEIRRVAGERRLDELEAERAVLGFTHPEVGSRVVERWRLPYSIVSAIESHHSTEGSQWPIGLCVSLAHAMVPDVLGVTAGRAAVTLTHADVMTALGLPVTAYPGLLLLARRKYDQLLTRYDA